MYGVSSSSLPSIRTWNQLNEETRAGKSAHCKVKRNNRVRCFWIDNYNNWWNSFGHTEETRLSRNYNSKFAEEIQIRPSDCTYVHSIDRHNAPNWEQRTLYFDFHQDTWNCDLMLRCVLAGIPWNTISNLKLWRSYNALCSNLVLPSASTFSNIPVREYSLTVDAFKNNCPQEMK